MPAISIFSPRSVSVMTVKRVASLPVPAVVGMAMTGSPAASARDGHLEVAHALPAPVARPCARIGHRLGGVDRRAAAETDQAVVAAPLQHRHARLDHGVGRLRHRVAEHVGDDAGGGERVEAAPDQAGADHERVGDHQRAGEAELSSTSAICADRRRRPRA